MDEENVTVLFPADKDTPLPILVFSAVGAVPMLFVGGVITESYTSDNPAKEAVINGWSADIAPNNH
jgi:hypothetical protein